MPSKAKRKVEKSETIAKAALVKNGEKIQLIAAENDMEVANPGVEAVQDDKAIPPALILPKNWPDEITYLTDLTYSDAVTAEQRAALGRTTGEYATYPRITSAMLAAPCPLEIRIITDEKHPAKGQRGLFAKEALTPDMFAMLYLGRVHQNSQSDTIQHSDYDMNLDGELGLSVDAFCSGNESRHANDYRGIADRPNADFKDCLIKVPSPTRAGGTKWERRVGIFVLPAGNAGKRKKGILAGEEVLVNYGKGYWESRKLMAKFRKDFEMLGIATAALEA